MKIYCIVCKNKNSDKEQFVKIKANSIDYAKKEFNKKYPGMIVITVFEIPSGIPF
jgi:hypothetical protein